MSKQMQVITGLGLLMILAVPAIRQIMEASMWRHMLLQFPLWASAAALLAGGMPVKWREIIARWNRYGISGLCAAGVIFAVLMIPRVLDQALLHPEIEAGKLIALILAGIALRLSWQPAGLIVQSFFLGNMLPMMGVIGWLYTESPQRLCNAYLLDDQIQLGNWLIGVAIATALIWLSWVAWFIVTQEAHQTSQQ